MKDNIDQDKLKESFDDRFESDVDAILRHGERDVEEELYNLGAYQEFQREQFRMSEY